MRKIMIRRSFLYISMVMVLSATGCVKETYDMNKLSKKAHLSPTVAISAIKGDVSLSDMVKQNDTVVFDQNNFVKIILKKDSVIDLKMADFYDLTNMVSFNQSYTIGDLTLTPFQGTIGYTLNQISQNFSSAQRNQLLALDDGSVHQFPPFPSTNLGETTYSLFANFENAVFTSGYLDISITNNLTAPLNSINVNLFNTSGHSAIGTGVTIPASQPGETQSSSIDLTNMTVTNSIIAAIVLSGSPGNTTPVLISLTKSNIQVTIRGRDLKIKSGRVILQAQTITTLGNKDTITFDPGSDVELDELKITTGRLSYHVQSSTPLSAAFTISLPTTSRGGVPVSELINISPGSQFNGSISFNNTFIDLGTDIQKPFNSVPMVYGIDISSNNTMINFNRDDMVQLDFELLNPVFDYIKGYFGQMSEQIDPDILDTGLDEFQNNITGQFNISNPSIKLNYSNSFGIPIEVTLNAKGKKNTQSVDLGLAPFAIAPATLTTRDVTSFIVINKANSKLPELVSLPPSEITFSGSAKMNPLGPPAGGRNNYVFGNSRFLGSLEVEVPLEFWINNLQFTDTVDNFMKDDGSGNDSPVKPEDFELLRVDITAKNGFPLGVSIKMSLYDSLTQSTKSTIDATGVLEPAPVDSNGKVTGVAETSTTIEFTREFFSSITKADKIIFQFTLNTTSDGSQDVKIYSDYRIDFNAALVVKPDINFK